jgi:hypothetical protein
LLGCLVHDSYQARLEAGPACPANLEFRGSYLRKDVSDRLGQQFRQCRRTVREFPKQQRIHFIDGPACRVETRSADWCN